MPRYDVLVTGAEERQGLAVVRSLGRRGLRVLAAGTTLESLGGKSAHAAGAAAYPSPFAGQREFAEAVARLAAEHEVRVVMPAVESTVIALDQHRDLFGAATMLALPPSRALARVLDKQATYESAQRLGVRAPATCYPTSVADGIEFARRVGYPIVMKPRGQSLVRGLKGRFDFKVSYVRDEAQLMERMQGFERQGAFPMLQEYCAGVGVAHSFLVVKGTIRGLYQHRRDREYPLTGGVASVIVSEPVDRELRRWTEALVGDLGWDGIAQVEYRYDAATNSGALMEINGRFWAPLSGALHLGLDFPYAWYEYLTTGDERVLPTAYPIGRRIRYLRGDLVALESYFRGQTDDTLQPLPGKWAAIWRVLRDFNPTVRNDIASWSDWRPGLHEATTLWRMFPGKLIGKAMKALVGGARG